MASQWRDSSAGVIGRLCDQVGEHWIWLRCAGCGTATKHDPADLAERLGLELPLSRLIERAKCARCGKRGATLTLQPAYLKDLSDGPRKVAGVNEPRYVARS